MDPKQKKYSFQYKSRKIIRATSNEHRFLKMGHPFPCCPAPFLALCQLISTVPALFENSLKQVLKQHIQYTTLPSQDSNREEMEVILVAISSSSLRLTSPSVPSGKVARILLDPVKVEINALERILSQESLWDRKAHAQLSHESQ